MLFSKVSIIVCFLAIVLCSCKENDGHILGETSLTLPYGICAHVTRNSDLEFKKQEFALLKSAGIQFVRTDFDWVTMQPDISKQEFDWNVFDSVVVDAKKNDISVLPIINASYAGKIPAWKVFEAWKNYVNELVQRYGNEITFWEICNEPDLWKFKDYSIEEKVERYILLLKTAYSIIKLQNPSSKVVLGGMAYLNKDFFDLFCQKGGFNYFDVMNFHTYAQKPYSVFIERSVELLNQKMKRYNWSKPVWVTETGFSTEINNQYSKEQMWQFQQSRLPQHFITLFSSGVDKVFWYNLRAKEIDFAKRGDNWGLLHANLEPKPAWFAYKTLVMMLPSGSKRPQMVKKGPLHHAKWTKPNGIDVDAFWCNSPEPCKLDFLPYSQKSVYDDVGNKLSLQSEFIMISSNILYAVSE